MKKINKRREAWVDVIKMQGIFAIYLGHFAADAGKGYIFVFKYHVALFFLLSGCMSNYECEISIKKFIIKKIQRILIPFYAFSFISIIINVLYTNTSLSTVINYLEIVLKGNIRNTFFASSLWFLSCLFIMEIIFFILKKYVKYKYVILLICFAMYLIIRNIYEIYNITKPSFVYNIDSVFIYIIYYAIGFLAYPYIIKCLKLDSIEKRIVFIIIGILSMCYSALLFMGISLFQFFKLSSISYIFIPIMETLILIGANIFIAKIFEGISIFREIGSNTLYLCGNEYIIKTIMKSLFGIVGIEITFNTPLSTYLYTIILLIIGIKYIIPIEKKCIEYIRFKCFLRCDYLSSTSTKS